MKTHILLITLALGIFGSASWADPHIYIVRHGEEPPDVSWGLGALGFLRAHALAAYFSGRHEIDKVYAAIPDEKSGRAYETCEPTALALGKTVQLLHKRDETAGLAKDLRKDVAQGKTVLVCWTNRNIKAIADALGICNAPMWDPAVFDDVWEITLNPKPKLLIAKEELPQTFAVSTDPFFTEDYGVIGTLKVKFPEEYQKILDDCPVLPHVMEHACHLQKCH